MTPSNQTANASEAEQKPAVPSISVPKGGGAIRGIGEKFAANPVTGTGSMTVPIATSPGRSGFGPQLSLSYDSGAGNGPFGFGWNLSLPSITRKTDKGLPKYNEPDESDIFILSGGEDLVPVLVDTGDGTWERQQVPARTVNGKSYRIERYRPRIEGLFARVERWTNLADAKDSFWRSISKDNITTWYGKTHESRIVDPVDPARIFSWLICESYDDKGNVIVYSYQTENSDEIDLSQAPERNRTDLTRSANRYLKRIKYGNGTAYYPILAADQPPTPLPSEWLFEVVLDYGEHDPDIPMPEETIKKWHCRNDPFSSYRAGFEVRTYRLCQRALMFHHFPNEPDIGANCLVRSTDLVYSYEQDPTSAQNPIFSRLLSVSQSGYKRQQNGYLKKSLPPLEFEYTQPTIDQTIREVDLESLENLPYGGDGARYQWVDLDGEGLSGILTEQADGWFYKRNLSPINIKKTNGRETVAVRFGPIERVAQKPSLANISGGRQQLLDLAGDGKLDLVEFSGSTPGFYERTDNENWDIFTPFESLPILDWDNPNLKFVDLTGDGHADILITEDEALCWHPSLAEAGFGAATKVRQALDEEYGPRLIFADGTQSIYLSDISGDGLTDLVRIRNGEVCYWPNLGHGRFGSKVSMDHAPWFDAPDRYDPRRIRLADIDGSGVTDIIYLGSDGIRIYFNQSGNSWAAARELDQIPRIDNLTSVTVADLLGNGTACLVWSSPLPGDVRQPMRYVDLMGGQKPHLIVKTINNLGAETHVRYAPSTKFYLADKAEGEPWVTRLSFPVHVVERVETYDRISRNRFVTRYAYHHGYFDGPEREFRGFGRVDQWDTEEFATLSDSDEFPNATNIDQTSHIPPVLTKTWFHTGAFLDGSRISRQFEDEYYRESDPTLGITELTDEQIRAMLIDDTVLPDEVLTPEELLEACRSLKGGILRQEIYALDGSEEEDRPYSVSERNYTIKLLQPRRENKHGVFFTHPREAINFHYERKLFDIGARKLADPRVSHAMTLEVDEYGNVLKSVAIGYGRRHDDPDPLLTPADRQKQKRTLLTYTENGHTNIVVEDDAYRTPLPSETRTYELINVKPDANLPDVTNLFRFDEMQGKVRLASDGAHDLPYEDINANGAVTNVPYRRLIEHIRTVYRRDDLSGLLPLGGLQSLALAGETYKLAFTPRLVSLVYEDRVTDAILINDGRYVHSGGDSNWWFPSGQAFCSPDKNHTPAQELVFARDHFFLPHRFREPFGESTIISYDNHSLLLTRTTDPVGNVIQAQNDYCMLRPRLITDPNGNRSQVVFDLLGLVVASAVMGKASQNVGDSLTGFNKENPTRDEIDAFLANPKGTPAHDLLQQATTRVVYDFDRYRQSGQPVFAATIARETHVSDLAPSQKSKLQVSFSYSDGFGREIQKKIQAEPGALVKDGPVVDPRWVGSGWTIFNNKGKPVRKYEPFFDDTHDFKFGHQVGVSPILFYDPVARVVATLHPNHTYEKVVFDPWQQKTWDVNDTVARDPRTDEDIEGYTAAYFSSQPANWKTWLQERDIDPTNPPADKPPLSHERRAAVRTLPHADTPTVAYFDTLGRPFLTVAHNRFKRRQNGDAITIEEKYLTRVVLDIEGNQRAVHDAIVQNGDKQGRIVTQYHYDMLGNRLRQDTMESGSRWMLNSVVGKPIYAWDSRNHIVRTVYDALQRPIEARLKEGGAGEMLVKRTVYGEAVGDQDNHRGRVYQVFDGAGVVRSEVYDFKGNLLLGSRQLAIEYKTTLNWSTVVPLEADSYPSNISYDALNRLITLTTPDNSVTRPAYNEANLLESIGVNLRGAATATNFVSDIDYNAKGQRERIEYGNSTFTEYKYDERTFRLIQLKTTRTNVPLNERIVQDLSYTYDPIGNVTHIQDDADIQNVIFFRNQRVEPSADYTYDAIYRLIEATGREHLGQVGGEPIPHSHNDAPRVGLLHPGDGNAMGAYTERYVYDAVGNMLEMQHRGSDLTHPGWTRTFAYEEASLIEPTKQSNRLSRTTVGTNNPPAERYVYDTHGNTTRLPYLGGAHPNPNTHWDYLDQVCQTDLDGGGTAYYVYDSTGQRVRKVWEKAPSLKEERIYLGGFEIFRRRNGAGAVTLERETLHIKDDQRRIALVETRSLDTIGNDPAPAQLIRYQFSNHLGSATLELDDQAQVISYEEYTPYGSTVYQANRSQTETPKRYRYTGKERDEENGLYYNGARYYAPWLGRWVSCDVAGLLDGVNAYQYARQNPIVYYDNKGMQSEKVLALAPYKRTIDVGGKQVSLNSDAGRKLAQAAARKSIPGAEVIEVTDMPGWKSATKSLAGKNKPAGNLAAIRSAVVVQEALEKGVTIHFDARGLNLANRLKESSSEFATLIGELGTGKPRSDIYILTEEGLSVVRKGTATVEGVPLPQSIAQRLPPSFRGVPPGATGAAAAAEVASATSAGASTASTTQKVVSVGGKVLRGVGAVAGVAGSAAGGVQIGMGVNKVIEGDTTMGVLDIAEGSSNVGMTIGTTAAVKSGTLAVQGGLIGGAATVGAGALAAGSLALAFEEGRRAARGEKTAAYEATEYYADMVVEGEKEGGVKGFLKQAGGWTGGFFSTLIAVGQNIVE